MRAVFRMYICLLALILWGAMILVGCNRQPAPGSGAQTPATAPRDPFATADGLLAQYNSLTTRDQVDGVGVQALYRAEDDLQKRIIEYNRNWLVMADLDQAMRERFNEPWNPNVPDAFLTPSNEPAQITERSDDHATAKCRTSKNTMKTLYLVKADGRWWLSGRTLQEEPLIQKL